MRVHIEAIAIQAPGLPDWPTTRAILAGEKTYTQAPLPPPMPTSLPPAERRRSSPTVRTALAVAEQALQQTPLPSSQLAMVFASREASGHITHQLCETLAGSREISPTQFHNSVHNAPSGYYTIAMQATEAATSICHGPYTFAAGLLDAAAQTIADQRPTLYVSYDCPLPSPFGDIMPITDTTAIALILTPEASAQTLVTWAIDLIPTPDNGETPRPAWIPDAWQHNASIDGLTALNTLVNRGQATLPLSKQQSLQISRCYSPGNKGLNQHGESISLIHDPGIQPLIDGSINHTDIAARIPHSGTMCLLDQVTTWDQQHIRCLSRSHQNPDNPLRETDGLPIWAGIEYAAQAAAVHASLVNAKAVPQATPQAGVLAALRNISTTTARLDTVADQLTIDAHLLHTDPSGGIYTFTIQAEDITLIQGQFTVMFTKADI